MDNEAVTLILTKLNELNTKFDNLNAKVDVICKSINANNGNVYNKIYKSMDNQ